jgi:uncharacterized protein YkwD
VESPDPSAIDDKYKQVLIDLVNDYRKAGCYCGADYFYPAPPVVWNDTLELVAKDHNKDMEAKKFFNHTGSDNSSPGDRINRYHYKWSSYGENIAFGTFTAEDVIKSWIESPGHCSNIMDSQFKEMGIAKSGLYWTQLFASK